MAENIVELLTDVADAIREKKGTQDKINAQNFAQEIRSIQGGGEAIVEEKDVNFFDYDGTLLFSYTLAEAQALTELPTPKGHEGLVFDGWNWDYEDVIALDYPMNIGAMYMTDDGKTRLYLEVEENDTTITLLLANILNGNVEIDFGDGASPVTASGTTYTIEHTYSKGSYVLTLEATEDSTSFTLISNTSGYNALGRTNGKERDVLRKVELGGGCGVLGRAFERCVNLVTITCPKEIRQNTTLGWTSSFANCISLKCINFPQKQKNCYGDLCSNCENLRTITLPNYTTDLGNECFSNNNLKSLRLPKFAVIAKSASPFQYATATSFDNFPENLTILPQRFFFHWSKIRRIREPSHIVEHGGNVFAECYSLEEIELSPNLLAISAHDFNNCRCLKEIVIPSKVAKIGVYAFYHCYAIKFDFSQCEQIPILENTNAFSSTLANKKIVVPDALYEDWKAATNWSTYADYIVKSSEYTD